MIEIVCPSCQARYQLPEGSIGPEGRKVSCSSCSHKWRAHAEVEGSPQAALMEASVTDEPVAETTVAAIESVAAANASESDAEVDVIAPPPASGDRDEQMAAIRQMLSDLKEGADSAAEPEEVEARPAPAAPTAPVRKRDDDDDDGRDLLKSRIDQLSKSARGAKGQPEASGYDANRLRRLHERKAKRLQRAKERRGKSGAFLTGFTLVSAVTATMVGLYVLHPQIIAASPQMAPALNEYVLTVDRYRVEFNDKTSEWRAWVVERIGKITDKEQQ